MVESDVSVVEITDGENVYSNEDGFAEEYEPISFSDEERLLALHRFDQGILTDKSSFVFVENYFPSGICT